MTTKQVEWIPFTGSDEQIAEMLNPCVKFALPEFGYLYSYENFDDADHLIDWFARNNIKEYLICNPHPLADMIIRQAQTGQPVYIKIPKWQDSTGYNLPETCHFDGDYFFFVTNKPDWHIPNAEYRFTPFDEPEPRPEVMDAFNKSINKFDAMYKTIKD